MATMQQLLDEAYQLMRTLSDMEDDATEQGDDEKAVHLNIAYFKANRRWWRRRNRQKQLTRRSRLEEVAA